MVGKLIGQCKCDCEADGGQLRSGIVCQFSEVVEDHRRGLSEAGSSAFQRGTSDCIVGMFSGGWVPVHLCVGNGFNHEHGNRDLWAVREMNICSGRLGFALEVFSCGCVGRGKIRGGLVLDPLVVVVGCWSGCGGRWGIAIFLASSGCG